MTTLPYTMLKVIQEEREHAIGGSAQQRAIRRAARLTRPRVRSTRSDAGEQRSPKISPARRLFAW